MTAPRLANRGPHRVRGRRLRREKAPRRDRAVPVDGRTAESFAAQFLNKGGLR
jgi:hypothetical protein